MAKTATTSTMNLSLPQHLRRYVETKVASGTYGSASEVVREALREKIEREEDRERRVLEEKLIAGLESGEPRRFETGYFDERKRPLRAKVRAKSKR